jgi:hypothetical protein
MISGDRIQYITHAGLILIVYALMMLIFFFVMSPVVDGFFTSYATLQVGDATVQVQRYGPVYHFVVKMMLAICLASPSTWFIFWAFSREPSKYRYKYR